MLEQGFLAGDVARKLGVSAFSLRAAETELDISVPRTCGGHRRYRPEDVIALRDYIRERRNPGDKLAEILVQEKELHTWLPGPVVWSERDYFFKERISRSDRLPQSEAAVDAELSTFFQCAWVPPPRGACVDASPRRSRPRLGMAAGAHAAAPSGETISYGPSVAPSTNITCQLPVPNSERR